MGVPIFLDSYGCQNLEGHIFPQPTDSEGPVISAQFKSVFSSTHNDWWKKHVAYIITYKNRHNMNEKKSKFGICTVSTLSFLLRFPVDCSNAYGSSYYVCLFWKKKTWQNFKINIDVFSFTTCLCIREKFIFLYFYHFQFFLSLQKLVT